MRQPVRLPGGDRMILRILIAGFVLLTFWVFFYWGI